MHYEPSLFLSSFSDGRWTWAFDVFDVAFYTSFTLMAFYGSAPCPSWLRLSTSWGRKLLPRRARYGSGNGTIWGFQKKLKSLHNPSYFALNVMWCMIDAYKMLTKCNVSVLVGEAFQLTYTPRSISLFLDCSWPLVVAGVSVIILDHSIDYNKPHQ